MFVCFIVFVTPSWCFGIACIISALVLFAFLIVHIIYYISHDIWYYKLDIIYIISHIQVQLGLLTHAKVNMCASLNEVTDGVKQVVDFPESWQTALLWDMYNKDDTACHTDDKLVGMAQRLATMGCKKLSEPSFAKAAAIACHKDKNNSALQNTKRLKMFFNTIPKDGRLCGPAQYPKNPQTLAQENPALWDQIVNDGAIVPSSMPEMEAVIRKTMQPCRSTKGDGANGANPLQNHRGPMALCNLPQKNNTTMRELQMHHLAIAARTLLTDANPAPPFRRQPSYDDILSNVQYFGQNLYNVSNGASQL